MTQKEFKELVSDYAPIARDCWASPTPARSIVAIVLGIAREPCYTDLMRGQRLRALVEALGNEHH